MREDVSVATLMRWAEELDEEVVRLATDRDMVARSTVRPTGVWVTVWPRSGHSVYDSATKIVPWGDLARSALNPLTAALNFCEVRAADRMERRPAGADSTEQVRG